MTMALVNFAIVMMRSECETKRFRIIILSFGIVIAGFYAHYELQKKAYKDAILVKVSDGTEFSAYYNESGLWKIELTVKGTHFESLTEATDPDSDNYSDILILMSGPLTAKYKTRGVSWKTVR